jgi:hypothetical protein
MRSQNCKKRLLALSCLSACPSVHPHGTTRPPLDRFPLNFGLFENPSRRLIFLLKSHNNNRHFTCRPTQLYDNISRCIMFSAKNVSDKIKTHILCTYKKIPKIVPFMRRRGKTSYSVRSHRLQCNTVQKICDSHGG